MTFTEKANRFVCKLQIWNTASISLSKPLTRLTRHKGHTASIRTQCIVVLPAFPVPSRNCICATFQPTSDYLLDCPLCLRTTTRWHGWCGTTIDGFLELQQPVYTRCQAGFVKKLTVISSCIPLSPCQPLVLHQLLLQSPLRCSSTSTPAEKKKEV